MDFEIAGERALLLASTRGLGFGCAAALAAEGVQVVINGRSEEHGIRAVSELGENAHFIRADISQPSERTRLFEAARAKLGSISILVTNADGAPSGSFMSKSLPDWQAAFELTMLSALDMVQRCIPGMVQQGYGRVINISSSSAREIIPGPVLANGLKPGLLGALGTLAREVASEGITINSILPGPFDTDLLRRYAQNAFKDGNLSPEEAVQRFAAGVPMKRLGTIEEFGALCAFLCSRRAGYITGQSIVIDGGKVPLL